MGDLGDGKALLELVEDGEGMFWLECSLLLDVVGPLDNVSLKSGNDECWSRLTCDERLLW